MLCIFLTLCNEQKSILVPCIVETIKNKKDENNEIIYGSCCGNTY